VNVTGTLNVLLAARDVGVRRVVYASSSSVYGLECLSLRYFNVFGPRQDPLSVVEANLLALESSAGAGEVFNAACGERVSLNSVIEMLSSLSGVELEPDYQQGRPGEVRHSQADIGSHLTEVLDSLRAEYE
jgi:nucleoside-diphosphate-sugar epimerase